MVSPAVPDGEALALEVFAAWLSEREAGGEREFEDLVLAHRQVAGELEALHASWKELVAGVELTNPAASEASSTSFEGSSVFVSRLTNRETSFSRYKLEREVARGGMGAILRVFDEDFRRALAMKVALADAEPGGSPGSSKTSPRTLARFLAEAQITGQLDHPGIVPVHEIGIDDVGRLYFTMKLVEGRDLKHVFQLVFEGRENWSLTRAVGVILKACEALAYAHAKGVIHRDLKPANVMVGGFGEVYVMDWGLARVLGGSDAHDIRVAEPAGVVPGSSGVRTDRSDVGGSELLTVDGDVLGTPAYMSPEQARGEVETLTTRSDVYSVGAMLYHLLARRIPYVDPGEKANHRAVLARVIAGPPRALQAIDARLPGEIVAICEKAMARDPAERYADTLALGEDLRAYLEQRVVAAYETGALAELKKWVARNKSLAAASAALVLSLAVGLIVSASLFVKAKEETARADQKASEAEQRTDDVLALSAIQDLVELVERADAAWPAHPENVPRYEEWLTDAALLIEGRPGDPARGIKAKPGLREHERKLAEIEQRGLPREPQGDSASGDAPEAIQWDFESTEDRWWHAQLARLIADLAAFSDPEAGLASAGTSPTHGWGIAKRLDFARVVEERSLTSARAQELWAEAIESIADRAQCPFYDGLALAPQLGLLPLGRDPLTGFWEFAHLQTGEPAERGTDGMLVVDEAMGLVLVLLPGGIFTMGAQPASPNQPGFDPWAASTESPVQSVTLDPFFLSKHEMTQAQWLRFTGLNPSDHLAGTVRGKPLTLLNPVERVTWSECVDVLARLGLRLPTEAQWEYAARGGSTGVWPEGDEPETMEGLGNLADSYCKRNGGPAAWAYDEWLDDGYASTAPVGTYLGNGFGLHDVIGNVWEWCKDGFPNYQLTPQAGEGERIVVDSRYRTCRGGSFTDVAISSRIAIRQGLAQFDRDGGLGLRPARALSR